MWPRLCTCVQAACISNSLTGSRTFAKPACTLSDTACTRLHASGALFLYFLYGSADTAEQMQQCRYLSCMHQLFCTACGSADGKVTAFCRRSQSVPLHLEIAELVLHSTLLENERMMLGNSAGIETLVRQCASQRNPDVLGECFPFRSHFLHRACSLWSALHAR